MMDVRKCLKLKDYCNDIYLSTKKMGTKIFKSCSYFESDGWLFVWTLEDSFSIRSKDVGDFVYVPTKETIVSSKSE
jgi:hypothetical protein